MDPPDPLVEATVLLNRILAPGYACRLHPFLKYCRYSPIWLLAENMVVLVKSSSAEFFMPRHDILLGSTDIMKDQIFPQQPNLCNGLVGRVGIGRHELR